MKILTIPGHPTPGSFNHGIADRAVSVLESMGQQMFGVVCVSTPEEREKWLGEVEAILRNVFEEDVSR